MKIKHLSILFLIASCAPTIKNFEEYQKQFLTKTAFMPSKDNLEGKEPKVVIFALDENGNEVAKQAGLGNSIANNIENVVSHKHLGKLVDRKAAEKLQKEISLAEMNKTGSYKGPQIADYAISGSISNAGFTNKYKDGSTHYDPKTGRATTTAPKYVYSSDVSGNIKIYELPSLAVVEAIEFSGNKARTENVKQNGGLSLGMLQIGGQKSDASGRDDNLVRQAGEDAIDNIKTDLQNSFAKKGYILEKRVFKDKSIFKITIGSSDGIKHGDKLEITGQYESQNEITNESEVERRIIASGTVTDKIEPKTAWIVIDDAKKANSVRLGDSIKMKYKRSSFHSVAKMAKSVIEQQ